MTTLEFSIPVQALIPQVEERMRSQANGYRPELALALDQLIQAGGKRIRPTVTLLTSALLGVDQERAITLGAAVELLHTATLVHDDLIDGALTRRGNPTINAQWDSSATILAGDFLFSQAAYLAAEVGSIDVMRMFAKTLSTIVNGEISQAFSLNSVSTLEDYYERIYAKTASMFELAARAPAYLVGQGADYADALLTYGYEIGMAFQIVDDVLDFSSDSQTIGKPAANDLSNGLLTLPVFLYAEEDESDRLAQKALAGDKLSEAECDQLIARVRESAAIEQSLERAKQHQDNARQAIKDLPEQAEKEALLGLADYVSARLL